MKTRTIKVPDVGEGIAEVELVAWHVAVGDAVAEDQPLADVMTDKASVEIPSPVAGRVLALGGDVGKMMAVGAELIRLEVAAAEDSPMVAESAPAPAPAAAAAPRASAPGAAAASPPAAKAGAVQADSGAAKAMADPGAVRPSPASTPGVDPAAAAARPPPRSARPIASPALRRRAWELGIDPADVQGSGSGGRILQADLDAHAAAHPSRKPLPQAAGVERNDETPVRVIGLRRRIAQQMQESKRHIPHFAYVEEVDVSELEFLRASLNSSYSAERGRITLLPLLMRAMVLAVREYPLINARFDDEAGVVTQHGAVHIGIATDTRHGLLVPVVRHAEARSVWDMAAEISRLADAARSGRATRAELSGSTITISSLGALGGIVSTPVINRPEVAIVAVNRMVERPMMRGGAVVARQMMNLSSSFDHRVVDGIDGARFVQALRRLLEAPALLFVQ